MNGVRTQSAEIVGRLQAAGFAAYWVGGCVRDFLLGKEPHDYDIATSARPEQIEALFCAHPPGWASVWRDARDRDGPTLSSGHVSGGGRITRMAAIRARSLSATPRPMPNAGISPSTACFMIPLSSACFDWVGGAADLKSKVLRTIGDPQARFAETTCGCCARPRFAAQLDFAIQAQTMAALQSHASQILSVSAERIREELMHLFRPPHGGSGDLIYCGKSGLLAHVLPEISATIPLRAITRVPSEGRFIITCGDAGPPAARRRRRRCVGRGCCTTWAKPHHAMRIQPRV